MKSVFSLQYRVFRHHMVTARKDAKLTQAALAYMLNKPQSFVAKYENGERRLDVVEFLAITQILKVDPCHIIRDIESTYHPQANTSAL